DVMRLLVDVGKFRIALISWHDPATRELIPKAAYGDTKRYAEKVRMFSDEKLEDRCPGVTAFVEAKPYVCNDFLADSRPLLWREVAIESGWCSSAGFPILIDGLPQGLLTVASDERNFFGPDQVELLNAVSLDIAFGLEHLDSEAHRRKAEAE